MAEWDWLKSIFVEAQDLSQEQKPITASATISATDAKLNTLICNFDWSLSFQPSEEERVRSGPFTFLNTTPATFNGSSTKSQTVSSDGTISDFGSFDDGTFGMQLTISWNPGLVPEKTPSGPPVISLSYSWIASWAEPFQFEPPQPQPGLGIITLGQIISLGSDAESGNGVIVTSGDVPYPLPGSQDINGEEYNIAVVAGESNPEIFGGFEIALSSTLSLN
jgi:hypothetical protein